MQHCICRQKPPIESKVLILFYQASITGTHSPRGYELKFKTNLDSKLPNDPVFK